MITYDIEILNIKKPLMIVFYTEWCGPCKTAHGQLLQIRQHYPQFEILKINADKYPDITKAYKVEGVPTFIILTEEKKEYYRETGYVP